MRTSTLLASLTLALVAAACGGKSKPAVGNSGGGGGTAAIPPGIHACNFVIGSDAFAAHRCDVGAGTIDKVSGMEIFTAKVESSGVGELTVTGTMGCGPMVEKCDQAFTATLRNEGGTWRGPVTPVGDAGDWWLAGATFELTDSAGYGGATYGDAWPQPEGE